MKPKKKPAPMTRKDLLSIGLFWLRVFILFGLLFFIEPDVFIIFIQTIANPVKALTIPEASLCFVTLLLYTLLILLSISEKRQRIILGLCFSLFIYADLVYRKAAGTPLFLSSMDMLVSNLFLAGNAVTSFLPAFFFALFPSALFFAVFTFYPARIFALPPRLFSRILLGVYGTSFLAVFIFLTGVEEAGPYTPAYMRLPTDFLAAAVYRTPPIPQQPVSIPSALSKKRNVLLIVDESIRGDFSGLSFPFMRDYKPFIRDFSPITSAGNCSHISRAYLRMAVPYETPLQGFVPLSGPSLWAYAKNAGYRTYSVGVFSASMHYMTREEYAEVDVSIPLYNDEKIAEALRDLLLDTDGPPKFIIAFKRGVHFDYKNCYPPDYDIHTPTSTAFSKNETHVLNTYKNALLYSVGHFFDLLLTDVDFSKTLIVYTSDHGQDLFKITQSQPPHCSTHAPSEDEYLVPLLVFSSDPLPAGGPYTHFHIPPTLLRGMGYAEEDIFSLYRLSSLYAGQRQGCLNVYFGDGIGRFSRVKTTSFCK